MHLFLDFDGVLHPKGAGQPRFTRLGTFENCLRDPAMRGVRVVISSTWRTAYSIEKLRGFFSPDIAERIEGTTATLRTYRTEHERSEEIEAYAAKNQIGQWVALDDDLEGFARGLRARLVLCDGAIGFSDVDAAKLRKLVAA